MMRRLNQGKLHPSGIYFNTCIWTGGNTQRSQAQGVFLKKGSTQRVSEPLPDLEINLSLFTETGFAASDKGKQQEAGGESLLLLGLVDRGA